ncbi:MAG: hypothetical protein A4E35_00268 [Methanoregula sp. PtaU1.Bin051]|nr:MAG: hypothetical protein A4E35_00268 [Methanoregula sp. PtaU1.Bin051]
MHADDVVPGMRVRYPRTGTTGTVQRIETLKGKTYAELDSTHLFYATDQLIPAEMTEKVNQTIISDVKKVIEQERAYAAGSELQEALKNIDQSCEGGG